jgi:phosphoglycolate phosphatase
MGGITGLRECWSGRGLFACGREDRPGVLVVEQGEQVSGGGLLGHESTVSELKHKPGRAVSISETVVLIEGLMRRSYLYRVVYFPIEGFGEFDSGADGPDAIVYDLDGTLVRLIVDWEAVATEVDRVLRNRGVDPPRGLWAMLEFAETHGHREAVEEVIGEHEREGARRSERLALADVLAAGNGRKGREESDGRERLPTGVCSLNCEGACRVALETHGLAGRVDHVVGRDSVATYKPDPEPLLTTVEALGATPERTLFVGDSERDERTATRAGTRFAYVSDLRSGDE